MDRWLWICRWLPRTREKLTLLDVGCGSGAFTINASARGYDCTGLSWDESSMNKANKRSKNRK